MKPGLLSTCFLLLITFSYSQNIRYYSDSRIPMTGGGIGTPIDYNHVINDSIYSYISTQSRVVGNNNPFTTIIKIDTSGQTIWTACPVNYIAEALESIQINFTQEILGADKNIYALLDNRKLAKIRNTNGSVDWIFPLAMPQTSHTLKLLDYDNQSAIVAAGSINTDSIQLLRFDKANGNSLGLISLYCPGPPFNYFYGISIQPNGNIYVANKDTCYKFTSFSNPALEWKTKMFTNISSFRGIEKISVEGANVFIFGDDNVTANNGIVSCLNPITGSFRWSSKNAGSYELTYADHKIKNGYLYTSWRYTTVGSTLTKCFINKIDINTGSKIWEFNHPFRTQPIAIPKPETMLSLEIDNNETLFLTGYGVPDNYTESSWGFMKIRGSDGVVLARSYVPNSDLFTTDGQRGYSIRLMGNKLYATGKLTGVKEASCRLDSLTLTPSNTKIDSASIQLTSSVIGIKNFSVNKKIVLKRIGKSVKVELDDFNFTKLWDRSLGDSIRHYEAIDLMSVNDFTKRIFITYRKYIYTNYSDYFFENTPADSLFIELYDSTGVLTNKYGYKENPLIKPYQFFKDSINRTWLSLLQDSVMSANTYPGLFGSIGGKVHTRPYSLIKPETYFPLKTDTVLLFIEPASQYSTRPALMKAWPPYNFFAKKLWEWPSLSIKWFNSVEREGTDNFYIMAKDSSNRDLLFKYRYSDSALLWSRTFDPSISTIKGYVLDTAFYTISQQNENVFIRKFNVNTGALIRTTNINVPTNHVFRISDFAISKQRQKITVTGFVVDTAIKDMSNASIITYDTAGNILNSYTTSNYKAWKNKGLSIAIGQDGQTIVCGQTTDSVYGYAGFIYEVDQSGFIPPPPIPQIINVTPVQCSSATPRTGNLLNPVQAPGTISIVMDNTNTLTYNPADSTFQYPISVPGNHTIRVTYSLNTVSAFKDTTFNVVSSPPAGNAPAQTGNTLTAPTSGSSYQWYLNSIIINGATSNTYVITQSGLYSYTYLLNGCVSPQSPSINATFVPAQPIPQIINVIPVQCSSATPRTGKLLNPVLVPGTISIVMDNTNTLTYNSADSIFQYPISVPGNHTIRVTYSLNTISAFKDTSFNVLSSPPAGNVPVQNGNTLTASTSGSSYQWYLNSVIINGATSNTYVITQSGLYSYTYILNGCVSPQSPSINATFVPAQPIPQIINVSPVQCSSATPRTGNLLNPVQAPGTISIVMDNTNTLTYNPADSTFQYPVSVPGNHSIRVTYSLNTISAFKDTSFNVVSSPPAGNVPAQNGNTLTVPTSGSSYQWYLNGIAINGATNNTFVVTQNGLYTYTYTLNGCTSPQSVSLNVTITVVIDPQTGKPIIIHPIPAKNSIFISNLNITSKYGVRIINQSGIDVIGYLIFFGSSSKEIDVSNIAGGTYIIQIWDNNKKMLLGDQKIIILR